MTISQDYILRRPTIDDVPEIQDIPVNHPIPTKFAEAAVIEKDDKIISFGVIRYILEALLYSSGSDRDKVESLKLLIEQSIKDAKKKNEDIYLFAENEEFARVLERHFGFRRLKSIPMMLEINNE